MNKKYLVVKLTITIILIISLPTTTFASLYHLATANDLLTTYPDDLFTPVLVSGVDPVQYHVSTSYLFNDYEDNAREGVESWNYSSGGYEIEFVETTTYWDSVCDLQGYDGSLQSYSRYAELLGHTIVWVGDGVGTSNNVSYDTFTFAENIDDDYFSTEVFINYAAIDASDDDWVIETFAHEAGHVLGLGHVEDLNRIMNSPYAGEDQRITPSKNEKEAVIDLYIYYDIYE